jgi:hypothetical protein
MSDSLNGKKNESDYECKICDFKCSYKSNYDIHISTRKHKTMVKNEGLSKDALTIQPTVPALMPSETATNASVAIPSNTCRYCNKRYSHLSALSRHKKSCPMIVSKATANKTQNITRDEYDKLISIIEQIKKGDKNDNKNSDVNTTTSSDENMKVNVTEIQNTLVHTTNCMKDIMMMMMTTSQLHSKIIETTKNNSGEITATNPPSIEVASTLTGDHNTNTINSNNTNNTFNMNMFLNEKCKDAMNMKDFINSIQLNMIDMENVERDGYVEGMSNILITNLQKTDVYKRPVHCSDVKRETIYVKDDNKWERDAPNHPKMVNAVLAVEQKNVAMVGEWAKAHPRCMNSSFKENEKYFKLSKAATDGEKDGNIAKVIRKVAKNVSLDKETPLIQPVYTVE